MVRITKLQTDSLFDASCQCIPSIPDWIAICNGNHMKNPAKCDNSDRVQPTSRRWRQIWLCNDIKSNQTGNKSYDDHILTVLYTCTTISLLELFLIYLKIF